MKKLFLLLAGMFLVHSLAWSQTDLTAEEIFERVIQHYDPDGVWSTFEGSIKLYSIHEDQMNKEVVSIDNADDFYQQVNDLGDTTTVLGQKHGKPFYKVNGKAWTVDEMPASFQETYRLNEHYARMFAEHHATHFGLPLVLSAAGAVPQPEVRKETIFGAECLAIQFSGLPNNYKEGGYNGPITLYVDPARDFALHAAYLDNGWRKDQKGMLNLFSGEMTVNGLTIPARRLFFQAADKSYEFIDVFTLVDGKDL